MEYFIYFYFLGVCFRLNPTYFGRLQVKDTGICNDPSYMVPKARPVLPIDRWVAYLIAFSEPPILVRHWRYPLRYLFSDATCFHEYFLLLAGSDNRDNYSNCITGQTWICICRWVEASPPKGTYTFLLPVISFCRYCRLGHKLYGTPNLTLALFVGFRVSDGQLLPCASARGKVSCSF